MQVRTPEPVSKIASPSFLLAWVFTVREKPTAVELGGHLVRFSLAQCSRAGLEVRPLRLKLHENVAMAALRLSRIFRLETAPDFALADQRLDGVGHPLPEPVDAGVRVFVGTGHGKGHVDHPCGLLGWSKPLVIAGFLCASTP